jgi:PKD repeat protein
LTADHVYASAGSYTVTLTVTDTDGLMDSTSTSVEATDPDAPIVMTTAVAGFEHDGTWATTQFFVLDVNFRGVEGADVSGEWTYFDRRGRERIKTVTATTDSVGQVTIRTRFRNTPPSMFCVTEITKPGYTYVASIPCGGLFEPTGSTPG